MNVLEYITSSALWAGLFFAVGYLMGKADRLLTRLAGSMEHIETEVTSLKRKMEEKE